ncbi:MAG: DUF3168 domain-containing protein [Sphingomonas sp.]|jgi:hypothetical protein
MSAEQAFQLAALAALAAVPGLNGVFDGPPLKATEPWAEFGELMSIDWGTKDMAGRELRSVIFVRDRGGDVGRVQALAAAANVAVLAIGPDLDGWRIASLVALRTRIVRERHGVWTAVIEHRVRMLAA